MAVIWTGRDPLEIAQLEANSRAALAGAEIASRENLFERAQAYRESSPENQLALAKARILGGMTPEEQKETMGVKSPVEREMQQAQLEYAKARPDLEEREMKVREDQLTRLADQFSKTYKTTQEELQLRKDAFQAKRDEFLTTTYNKNKQDFLKRLSDLGANKEEIGSNVNAFLAQTVQAIQNPALSSDTAFGIGADAAYSIIDIMKRGKLSPEQNAQLRQSLAMVNETMRKRAVENPALAPSYQAFKQLSSAALAGPQEQDNSGLMGWAGAGAGAGAWLLGKKYMQGRQATPSLGKGPGMIPPGGRPTGLEGLLRGAGLRMINPVSTGMGAYFLSQNQGEAMPGYSPFSELAHGRTEFNPENPFGEVY